jgi:hexosaminidase
MYQPGPGVFLPSYVEVEFSNDGINFTPMEKLASKEEPKDVNLDFKTYHFNWKEAEARYIRVLAPNGMRGFMFVDEIVVY